MYLTYTAPYRTMGLTPKEECGVKVKLWTKEYILSIVTLFICHIGPYLALSVISIYAKQLIGSDTLAGMMVSVFPLCGIAARFLSAGLLDRFRCKQIVLLSVAGMVVAAFGYLFCDNYWLAFGLRGLLGFCYCVAVTAVSTYIVKIIHPDKLLEGIGYSSLTGSLCGVIGPTAAFALIGPEQNRFPLLFIVIFGSSVAAFLTAFTLKDIKRNDREGQKESIKETINWEPVIFAFLVLFICSLASSAPTSFLSLYALDKGLGNIGAYFSVNALGLLLSRFTMKKIVDKLGNYGSILLFAGVECVGTFAISGVSYLWQLLVISFPMGFAMGALYPIVNTYIIHHMPPSRSGMANAIFYAAGDMGVIIGATLWGFVSNSTSYEFMFGAAASVVLLSILMVVIQMKIVSVQQLKIENKGVC